MVERPEFCRMVREALEATCEPGRLPNEKDQLQVNRMGIHLAWLWATHDLKGPKSNVHLYANEHRTPKGDHLSDIRSVLEQASANLHVLEFLTDVFIERFDGKCERTYPLVAAEIEASSKEGVDYVYEGPGRSDYLRDFSKVLYVRVPKRLFVARTRKGLLDKLQATLLRGYKDANLTQDDGVTVVVLLPAGETESKFVRVGLSSANRLEFETNDPWAGRT